MDLIAKRLYQVIVVHSLDRFSRQPPRVTEQMLNHVTDCGCRFIAIGHNLDSDNEMNWYAFKGLFAYFSNMYSKQLSEKVKLGMKKKQDEIAEKGFTISKKTGKKIKSIGRPRGSKDRKIRSKKGYYQRYEEGLPF